MFEGTKLLFRVAMALLLQVSDACLKSGEFAMVFSLTSNAAKHAYDADLLMEVCMKSSMVMT